jgi:glycolate oxidase FAD binding subunit
MPHAPASLEEASTLVARFAAECRTIGIVGGDAPPSGPAAVAVDEVLSTTRLEKIVDYAPADQIVTVQAGVTIAHLQAVLGERNQRLALDPPFPGRTTVGGAVAANRYGPLRTRYGTAKDLIVGMTIVRADGALAHGGGKVVKNVAGFDVPKLMVGTYGTLALIGTVTFRVHPLPQTERSVVFRACDAAALRRVTRAMTQLQLEPSASYAIYDGNSYTHCVRFEGFASGVLAQRERLLACIDLPAQEAGRIDLEHEASRTQGEFQIKISAPASRIEELHARAIVPVYDALANSRAALYPSVGVAFVSGDGGSHERIHVALIQARAWAESAGGTLVVEAASAAVRATFDSWGTPPPAFALMCALKDRFDPERRLNPGGFVGGL